jgi:hypothetical protein
MELVLWVIVALLVATSSVFVAKARQFEMLAIESSERPASLAHIASRENPQTREPAIAWYRRQDTNRRSIWLKQW